MYPNIIDGEEQWTFVSDPVNHTSYYVSKQSAETNQELVVLTLLHSPYLSCIIGFLFPRSVPLQRVVRLFLKGVSFNYDISAFKPQGLWMDGLPCDLSLTIGDISKDRTSLAVVIQDAPVSIVVSCQCSLGSMRLSMFDYQTIQLALETYVKVGKDIRMRP